VAPPRDVPGRTRRGVSDLPPSLLELAAARQPSSHAAVTSELLSLAREHRMAGLLWTWLREQPVDPTLKRELGVYDLYVRAHQQRMWNVLEWSVARLATAGLDVATIKGVTAEARWYGREGERPCSDVDLLLSPLQRDRASAALAALQPDHPWVPHVDAMAARGQAQSATLVIEGIEVDLHFDALKLGMPSRQAHELWARAQWFRLRDGTAVRVLDETSALLHLLVHLNKDRFQRLLGYADIARIVGTGRVDWGVLLRLAEGDGIEVSVLSTLEVVVDELALPWPEELDRPRGPRARLWRLIWHRGVRLRGREGRLRYRRRQDLIGLLARGRAADAIRWWIRDAAPPAPAVSAHYAHIGGPYPWKLVRGRAETLVRKRRRLATVRERRP
jgi:hypothetical protein